MTDTEPTYPDPRWEWVEERSLGQRGSTYARSRCNHLHPEPVYSGDELVAWLCLDCDTQLAAPGYD